MTMPLRPKMIACGASMLMLLVSSSILAKVDAHRSIVVGRSNRQTWAGGSLTAPNHLQVSLLKKQHLPLFLSNTLRGGAARDEYSDDDDESENDNDDADYFDLNDEAASNNNNAESDFANDNMLDRVMVAWEKTPPITKGYLAASFAATMYGSVFCKNQFPSILLLDWNKVLRQLQIWRLFTSFLNVGPMGIGYFLTGHFLWTYMATLERVNHKRPYDFWILVLFGQLSMVVGYPLLRLSPLYLGHNLSTYFVYIWSRYHEGVQVSMFDLFTTRAEMLPWFFLAQTFLLEGAPPILDLLGIVFGHCYHYLKRTGALTAPDALVEWYESSPSKLAMRIRNWYRPISSDFEMI